jgi:hypothetical protein
MTPCVHGLSCASFLLIKALLWAAMFLVIKESAIVKALFSLSLGPVFDTYAAFVDWFRG